MKLQVSQCFAWLIEGFKSPFAHHRDELQISPAIGRGFCH